jgi:uncharacterized membrane protein YqaE (UPF0057 family)
MASTESEVIDVPRPQKSVTFGLIILAFFMPWLALYLDGSSYPSIWFNLAAFFFLFPVGAVGAIIHAIVCLCRTDEHRKYSKPARRRLRYQNNYSAKPHTETKAVEPEPSPAPVKKTVTEPPPAPVTRAVNEGPAPVERAPTALPAPVQKAATEPPVVKSAATSSASVSSSDVEKETPPVAAPPPKKEDDPFRDPVA